MNQNNTKPANLDFMRMNIMSRLNLDYLPEADRLKLLDSMTEVVEQRVFLNVLQTLSKDKNEALSVLLDEGQDEEISKFIEENVPEFINILQREIDTVSNDLASLIKK
ncbi:MAG: DUF5663 domain-containing protein [Patescibacteria group bacterium]